MVKSSWSNEAIALADDPRQKLQAASWVQLEVARLLLALSGKELDEAIREAGTREFKAFELPVRMQATIDSRVRRFESSNVVAMLPAADKASAKQAVRYSAHPPSRRTATRAPVALKRGRVMLRWRPWRVEQAPALAGAG